MVLTSPLVQTKLRVPRPRGGMVARPRLDDRLNRITESKLTLISAPAGFGKSTLIGQWLAASANDALLPAWFSADPADNERLTFWTYLVCALREVIPEVGEAALSMLESSPPRIEPVLASLLNDLAAVNRNVVLVLDDYHAIDDQAIQEEMAYFPGPPPRTAAPRDRHAS